MKMLTLIPIIVLQAVMYTAFGKASSIIVATDGTGTHTDISQAIDSAPNNSLSRVVILVKKGKYNEQVHVPSWKTNIFLKGEGSHNTVIYNNRNAAEHIHTDKTATFGVDADGFMAEDIQFVNSAGADRGQAVAFRSAGNKTILHRCVVKGYQDSLYTQRGFHFFRDTKIYGTVDFIFGDSQSVFQNCEIYFRIPVKGQPDVMTAQGRQNPDDSTGLVFQNCSLSADPESPEASRGAYLGRPWKTYSRIVIMESDMGNVVNTDGWLLWDNNSTSLSKVYYAEYNNRGAGSYTQKRLNCPGCKVITDPKEAESFTVRNFIQGTDWIPPTGVPFFPDLSVNS